MAITATNIADRRDHDVASELCDTPFERRLRLLGGLGERGDMADLGGESGRDDHGPGATGGHVRAGVDHVAAIGERRVRRQRTQVLGDRDRLARQRGLGDLQGGAFDEPRIGGDGVAGLEQQEIAGNDVARLDECFRVLPAARAPYGSRAGGAPERSLRPPFLESADDGVQEDDDEDDDGIAAPRRARARCRRRTKRR